MKASSLVEPQPATKALSLVEPQPATKASSLVKPQPTMKAQKVYKRSTIIYDNNSYCPQEVLYLYRKCLPVAVAYHLLILKCSVQWYFHIERSNICPQDTVAGSPLFPWKIDSIFYIIHSKLYLYLYLL
jgi:hypothetical protein